MNYKLIKEEHPGKFLNMPDGLDGYWWETEHVICIPVVISDNEGSGIFSKWLSILETKGKTIFFPTVISARLDAILRERGYIDALSVLSKPEQEIYGQKYVDGLALFSKEHDE